MQLSEEALLTLKLDGKPMKNALGELETQLQDVKRAQADLTKGTKEWADSKAQIKQLEAEIAKVRETMGAAGMTVKQLQGYAQQLNKEIRDLTPGTEAYVAKTKELRDVNTRLQAVRDDTRAVHEEAAKGESLWGKVKGWIAGAFTVTAIFEAGRLLIGFFKDAYDGAKKLDSALADFASNTGQKYKDSTGELSAEMKYFKEQAKELGLQVGMSAEEVVNAYTTMGSAKSDLVENKEALAAVTKEAVSLAQAAGIQIPDAADTLGQALNQFGADANQAGRYVNIMAASAQVGAHRIDDVTSALKVSGTVASGAGVSFEEVGGLLAVLSKNGLKGAEAGTQLRNVLLTLQSGAKDTNPQIVGLQTALENLAKKNLSATGIMETFSKENVTAAQTLLSHTGQVKEFTKAVTGTSAAYQMQQQYLQSDEALMKQAEARYKSVTTELGEKLRPAVLAVVSGFTSMLEWISKTASGATPLGVVFKGVAGYMGQLWDVMGDVLSLGWDLAKTLFPSLTLTVGNGNAVMKAFATALYAVVAVIKTGITSISLLVDSFRLMALAGNTAWSVLKGDMSIKEGWKTLTDAAAEMKAKSVKNFTEIGDGFKKIWTDGAKSTDAATKASDDYTARTKANAVALTKAQADELAKQGEQHTYALTTKEKKEADKRDREEKAEAAKEKRIQEAAEKSHQATLDAKDKATLEAIADERQRKISLMAWERDQEVEKILKSVASEKEKNEAIDAADRALKQKITDYDKEYRDKKKTEDDKLREETAKKNAAALKEQQDAEFAASKAILERQLLDKNLSVSKRKELELALIKLETDEKLASLKLKFDTAISTAERENRDTTALKAQYDAEKGLLEAQYQGKMRDLEEESKQARMQKWREFSGFLSDIFQGNFTSALAYLDKQYQATKESLSKELRAFVDKTDQVADYARLGLDLLSKLNEAELKKQLTRNEAEKKDALAKWEEKYKKGLIDKATYELGVNNINKDFDAKEKDLRFKAWRRQKNIDIATAVVNGIQSALKSFATMGWPLGLIGAAAAGIQTALMIKKIKQEEPPVFALGGAIRNAGVPDGPGHNQGGIKLIDSQTGHIRGEMEGGEPIMILSRNTYRNNRRVIDKLLHSSLHQNGKAIYRDGGIYADSPGPRDYPMYLAGGLAADGESQDGGNTGTTGIGGYSGMSAPGGQEAPTSGGTSGSSFSGASGDSDTPYWDTSAGEGYLSESGDYSGASANSAQYAADVAASKDLMQKIINNTACLPEIRDLLRDGNSIQRDQSGKLDNISGNTQRAADKPPVTINQITQEVTKEQKAQAASTFGAGGPA